MHYLNDCWRIVHDELQWILQKRKGSQWGNRSYCVTREGLHRCIREYCPKGVVFPHFPDRHPDRVRPVLQPRNDPTPIVALPEAA